MRVPMLVVCGMYQLFGDEFVLSDGETLKGVGVFEGMKTIAGKSRLIGNVTGRSDMFGDIYGYENHSGRTYLADSSALATVPLGEGNNGEDETEGAIYRNVIGTYLHGSVLPKNPKIADFLLEQAFIKRYKRQIKFRQLKLDTDVTDVMRDILEERPR